MVILRKINIKDVRVKDPYVINVDAPFSQVWELLRTHSIRHLPVVDSDKKLRGMITQRDLYRTIAPRKKLEEEGLFYEKEDLDRFILRNVMTKKSEVLYEEDTLGKALDIFIKKKFGSIPVVNLEGFLVGIITPIDVLRAISEHYL
jgi:CBS domain-containing protein